jgi:predicted membrane protein
MIIFTVIGIFTAIFFFVVIIMSIIETRIKNRINNKLFWNMDKLETLTDSDLIDEIQNNTKQ